MDDERPQTEQIPIGEPEAGAADLMRSPAMKPYVDLMMAVTSGKDATAAVQALKALPLERRYIWRVALALKLAFGDLETSNVEADCQTLSPADQERLVEALKLRPFQFCLFLSALIGPGQMEELMLEAVRTARSVTGPGE